MIICHDKKFVFVSTPKAGTHTMYNALKKNFKVIHYKNEYHSNIIPEECKDYFKFTTVRNPYTRAISSWWQIIGKPLKKKDFYHKYMDIYTDSFQDFTNFLLVKSDFGNYPRMFMSQYEWHNSIQFDAILKIETLQQDYDQLYFSRGESLGKDFSLGKDRTKKWDQYYTDSDYKNINKAYKEDFEVYNYARI